MKEKKFTVSEVIEMLQAAANGEITPSTRKYALDEIYTTSEASEVFNININTIKSKFKASLVGQDRIDEWINDGLIRQSGSTWLISRRFIEENFKM